jgi:hypothetical protein
MKTKGLLIYKNISSNANVFLEECVFMKLKLKGKTFLDIKQNS